MEKTLTITPTDLLSVQERLQAVTASKADTTLGMQSVSDVCAGAQCMAVSLDGVDVGAYAVRPVQHEGGIALWVMAVAGALEGVSLVKTIGPAIEAQAVRIGAKQICFTTKRAGLVKLLKLQGYQVTGITMRKAL